MAFSKQQAVTSKNCTQIIAYSLKEMHGNHYILVHSKKSYAYRFYLSLKEYFMAQNSGIVFCLVQLKVLLSCRFESLNAWTPRR